MSSNIKKNNKMSERKNDKVNSRKDSFQRNSNGGNMRNSSNRAIYSKSKRTDEKSNAKIVDESIHSNRIYLIPLGIILTVVPLIMKLKDYDPKLAQYSWYSYSTSQPDFFLYYKNWTFVSIALIMAMIILIRGYINRSMLKFTPLFLPLAVYGLLAFLSAIFSISRYHSFMGSLDQFESIFVLLGYCLVIYYAYLFIRTEEDIKFVIRFFIIGVILLSLIGITQYLGHDIFASDIGKRIVTSSQYIEQGGDVIFNFENGRVYMTLFNPNYVGVYVSMVAPILLILLLFSKRLINSLLYVIAIVGLAICEIGSQSLAGLVGLGVAAVSIVVFLWRYLLKRFYIAIPAVIVVFGALYLASEQTDHVLINKVLNEIRAVKVEKSLTEISTLDDSVVFTYKGNRMFVSMNVNDSMISMTAMDDSGNIIDSTMDSTSGIYYIQDERFPGIAYSVAMYDNTLAFYVQIDGVKWYFTNLTEDGTYYIINRFGKLDKAVTPPDTFLTGYEDFASKRGFLWSRTLPLIKKYILIGAGPDNYIFAYPQQDYIGYHNYFQGLIATKPHSLYLQVAVQTGVLSLIAFLVFYLMYFISSIRLYIRGRFNSYFAQLGVAIFIGTFAYMITGITNDSSLTTAPVFWTLMGIGIVANHKAKPLIMEERKSIKQSKAARREAKRLTSASVMNNVLEDNGNK